MSTIIENACNPGYCDNLTIVMSKTKLLQDNYLNLLKILLCFCLICKTSQVFVLYLTHSLSAFSVVQILLSLSLMATRILSALSFFWKIFPTLYFDYIFPSPHCQLLLSGLCESFHYTLLFFPNDRKWRVMNVLCHWETVHYCDCIPHASTW